MPVIGLQLSDNKNSVGGMIMTRFERSNSPEQNKCMQIPIDTFYMRGQACHVCEVSISPSGSALVLK